MSHSRAATVNSPCGEAVREPACGEPGTRAAEPAASERPERLGGERRERPGLTAAEIGDGMNGAASVLPDGAVVLNFTVPVTVKIGMDLRGQRKETFGAVTFRPLPSGFRASGGDRLLSVFIASTGLKPKAAKALCRKLPEPDWTRVQVLTGHVMMVASGNTDPAEHAELLAALSRNA